MIEHQRDKIIFNNASFTYENLLKHTGSFPIGLNINEKTSGIFFRKKVIDAILFELKLFNFENSE